MKNRLPELTMAVIARYDAGLDDVRHAKAKGRAAKERHRVARRRLEQVLVVGNWLFRSIRLIERNWRAEVSSGQTPYNPTDDQTIRDYYRQWAIP